MIDCVIFDIGNVLLDWDPRYLYRRIFSDDGAVEAFLAETGLLELNLEFDRGEPFAPGLARLARRFPQHAGALAAFDARWLETVGGVIAGPLALLERLLEAGLPVYAISNFSREKFNVALDAFPFLRRFHDIVISGDLKILKPDPRIYAALIERRRFDPARAFFIDDNERNVAAARRLGMRAHHYRGPAALFADCRALGLPVPDIA